MRDSSVPVTVVFGVPVERVISAGAMEIISELIADTRMTGRTHQIATVNVDLLVNAVADSDVLALLKNRSLNLSDGMPVLWASRLLRATSPERVAGADLLSLLAADSERRGWRIHLLGGRQGVAERARSVMLSNNTGAMVTADSGPASEAWWDKVRRHLENFRARDVRVTPLLMQSGCMTPQRNKAEEPWWALANHLRSMHLGFVS